MSLLFLVGLLVLAGALFTGQSALAQSQECLRPAGVTPVEPPSVTAQEVDAGGSLEQFVLDARARSREHAQGANPVEQGLYIACLVRQEGGPWRTDSTYLVSLTVDGRVFLHAKDMSLSGGLLDPAIYSTILLALGVQADDLAALASDDPAVVNSAFQAILAILTAEPEEAFDATTAIPNVRPGIPGASGHAAVYVDANLGGPIILLGGFDLRSSHLAKEDIDHGDPDITAKDVVNRETLKAFVTHAGEYFVEILESGDAAAASRARIALRDPNGPWRHGSVYLYVLDLVSNTITFHAANPNRFEYRPLVPTVKDAVTGEYILPQVIEAAQSSREGGFIQYYFDDPTDDSDSADIPKVGYAREFSGDIPQPDGSTTRGDFIVGSGFYLNDPGVIAERLNTVVETVLPQVMRAMTAGTVDAVSGRIEQAISGAPPAEQVSFGGASSLPDVLMANGQALQDGTFDLGQLLGGSSFVLPLDAGDGQDGGTLTLWARGDYRSIAGGNPETVDYDGEVVNANFGIDGRLSKELLAGVALSQSRGTVDYTDSYAVTGELTANVTSVNPYVGLQMPGGTSLWAMAGYGTGEVEIDDETADAQASDMTQTMAAAGASVPVVSDDALIPGGTANLRLKGEMAVTRAELDGSEVLASTTLSVNRSRLILEGSHEQTLDSGATFTPTLELGMRRDGGDGETGTAVETGAGVRYADPASGLVVEGQARTLLSHSGDYEEWGVSAQVRVDPGAEGRGFSLSLAPAWGQTGGDVQQLWESDVIAGASPGLQAAGRVSAEIGYGLGAARGLGVVTPYAGLGLAEAGARSWRMGARWQVMRDASLSLEAARHEAAGAGGPADSLMLRSALHW